MSTLLEADESGALSLPASLLPHAGPGRRYRVTFEGNQVVVDEVSGSAPTAPPESVQSWLDELRELRNRQATGRLGATLQEILDEAREEPP